MSLFYIHICKNKTTVHKLKYFSPEDGASNHPKFHIEQDLDNHPKKSIYEYDYRVDLDIVVGRIFRGA